MHGLSHFQNEGESHHRLSSRAEHLPLGRSHGKKRWFPQLTTHFRPGSHAAGLRQHQHRPGKTRLTDWLRDQMVRQQFDTEMAFGPATLPAAIVEAARQNPGKIVLQDATLHKLPTDGW